MLSKSNEGQIFLPSNINILSWNYDFQFELSLLNFIKTNKIQNLENYFKILPNSKDDFTVLEEFCLIKLNGKAGGLITDEKFLRKNFFSLLHENSEEEDQDKLFEKYIQIHKDIIQNYNSTIKDEKSISSIMFAWEKNELADKIKSYTNKKISETSILTVIGYSFPTFNREIDKEILKNMYQLDKIIIQAPINDIESIEFRVRSLLDPAMIDITIKKVYTTNEFFIPFEFN
ncbi:MAG: hypothetical protein M3Z56_08410 [Bacteroidota bacterium]|nr:hypothetical protein [Bacteroidota bacterium]